MRQLALYRLEGHLFEGHVFSIESLLQIFSAILLSTSPTLIGLSPGSLSNEINLHAANDSRDSEFIIFSKPSLLTNSTNALRISDDAVLNERDVNFFLQLSASRPDGPDSSFVSIAAFKRKDYPYLHILLAEQVVSVLAIIFLGVGVVH